MEFVPSLSSPEEKFKIFKKPIDNHKSICYNNEAVLKTVGRVTANDNVAYRGMGRKNMIFLPFSVLTGKGFYIPLFEQLLHERRKHYAQ